jgi:hypothetical protein
MRYNPRTDQALSIEEISEQCWQAVRTNQQPATPSPARVWDCRNGGWLPQSPGGRPVALIA